MRRACFTALVLVRATAPAQKRWRRHLVALTVALCALPYAANAKDERAERQASLDDMLTIAAASNIADYRDSCAAGRRLTSIARSRALGMTSLPDAVDMCITALIRTAKDGTLRYLRNTDGSITPALALDTGFVAGYDKAGSVSALPTLDALRPKAERCLAQAVADTDLCYSIGYAYGVRAAAGETVLAH